MKKNLLKRVRQIVRNISYKDWVISTGSTAGMVYAMLKWEDTCAVTGALLKMSSRKWFIEEYYTDGDIVRTIFKMIKSAEEHEVQERFQYRGKRIFDPHMDAERLLKAAEGDQNV